MQNTKFKMQNFGAQKRRIIIENCKLQMANFGTLRVDYTSGKFRNCVGNYRLSRKLKM